MAKSNQSRNVGRNPTITSADVARYRRRVGPRKGCLDCRASSLIEPTACKEHTLLSALRALARARRAS